MAEARRRLARLRVPLGFAAGALVLLLAQPSWTALTLGTAVACAGEAMRIWAAGHLEKSREVTRTGPYRWLRHPLYAGSTLMGVGVAAASQNAVAAAVVAGYLLLTLPAAVRTEEAFLRAKFGAEYDDYRRGRAGATGRAFSWARAWRNREYRAVLGMGGVFAILALKALLRS